jgi:flavin reductase (DIM6/NTAB) family NADH-FMN oxidoreductase RutF
MAHFPTGVTIVASRDGDTDQGMTANSLSSVSLDPPLIAINMARGSRTERAIASSRGFAVTLLAHDQADLAQQFATKEGSHFEGLEVERSSHGHAYLPAGLGYLECVVWEDLAAGDHSLIIGQVIEASLVGGRPLIFFRSKIGSLPHDHHPWTEPRPEGDPG